MPLVYYYTIIVVFIIIFSFCLFVCLFALLFTTLNISGHCVIFCEFSNFSSSFIPLPAPIVASQRHFTPGKINN